MNTGNTNLSFVDVNCAIGRMRRTAPKTYSTPHELIARMNRYGIDAAFVYHTMSLLYDAWEGNMKLIDELGAYENLHPVWVVLPHHTGEFPAPDELIELMHEHDVRMVRAFPSAENHQFSIAEWNCGGMWSALEREQIPLAVGLDQIKWEELYTLATTHPELTIILCDVGYRIARNLFSLMKLAPNVYLETSAYKVHRGLEELCMVVGAERLLFGTGMPVFSGGAAASMIRYARIGEEAQVRIASHTILSLTRNNFSKRI